MDEYTEIITFILTFLMIKIMWKEDATINVNFLTNKPFFLVSTIESKFADH